MVTLEMLVPLVCVVLLALVEAGTKSKPHAHSGVLQNYDGKHIPYSITLEQRQKLDSGQPVRLEAKIMFMFPSS